MAVSTASNHQLTPPLNRYVVLNPQDLAKTEERKALLYNVVSKVCLVAFLAIFAISTALAFGLIPLAVPAFVSLLFILSACLTYLGFQYGAYRSIEWRSKAIEDQGQAAELQKIQNWGQSEILAFLKEHQISLSRSSTDPLQRLNEKEPLKALLPAIARYLYWSKVASQYLEAYAKNFSNDASDPDVRAHGGVVGWQILEARALPAALQAALMLQVISQPTLQTGLADIGTLQIKSFANRSFEAVRYGTDDYFIFKESDRPSLSVERLKELIHTKNFDQIRAQLFNPVKGSKSPLAPLR